MNKIFSLLAVISLLCSCTDNKEKIETEVLQEEATPAVKMVSVVANGSTYKVYTKKHGENDKLKVLVLHGGPGCSHKYLSNFEPHVKSTDFEFYYYDQLGSGYSDHPKDTSLWNINRFVEEVEQVRKELGLTRDNFILYGQSWGGILAIEYALKYQQHLKGLVISNMMASCPEYTKYVNEILGPQLPNDAFKEIKEFEANQDFQNPRYMEILMEHYYAKHVLRMPLDKWPAIVNEDFDNINSDVYVSIQGPSEFGIIGDAKLKNWDRSADLSKITVPTLTIGAKYDTMDPEYMKWMASQFKNGTHLYCPNGSHLAMWDDANVYFNGLKKFVVGLE